MNALDLLGRLRQLGVGLSVTADRLKVRAPDGVLTSQLREEITAQKPELLRLLAGETSRDADRLPITRESGDGPAALSPGQERLWGLIRRAPETPAYNLVEVFSLRGPLDADALERGVSEIARRHESLRTTIQVDANTPVVRVEPPDTVRLVRTDVRSSPDPLSRARDIALRDARSPFDLAAGPLARFHLLQCGEEEYVFAIVIHHIVSDGWSFEVLYAELTTLYERFRSGLTSPLGPPSLRYVDVAAWQRRELAGARGESLRAYWTEQLAGPLRAVVLPADSGVPSRGYVGQQVSARFPLALRLGVERLSAECNASAFMVLLAGYACVIGEPSGQNDSLICSPVAARERPELQHIVGYLNNVLVLRVPTGDDPPFDELVARVRRVALEGYRHQDFPFQEVARLPNLVRLPLTRAMFAFQADAPRCLELDGVEVGRLAIHNGTANFDIGLTVRRTPDGLDATLAFRDGGLGTAAGLALLDRFRAFLEAAVGHPRRRISELDPRVPSHRSRTAGADLRDEPGPAVPDEARQMGDHEIWLKSVNATEDPLELRLTLIWERVLGVRPIQPDEDFFGLGGHSLLAVRLLDELEDDLGRALPLATFFDVTTIHALTRALRNDGWEPPTGPLVTLQAGGAGRPLFLLHSFEGHVFFFADLARQMAGKRPVFGFQAPGLDGRSAPPSGVEDLARLYCSQLRRAQPNGPYVLGAMCFGLAVALEMAAMLRAEEEEVHLVFIDSALDGRRAMRTNRPFPPAGGSGASPPGFVSRLRARARGLRARADRVFTYLQASPYARRERRMRSAMSKVWDAYLPRTIDGPVTLVRSGASVADPGKAWHVESLRALAAGGLATHTVPGDHFGILREPHVSALADHIQSVIDQTAGVDGAQP